MKTQTYDRFVVMAATLLVLITIFIAKDRFNFLSYTSTPTLADVRENKVSQLAIDDGRSTVQLAHMDNTWYVKRENILYKADQSRVESLLSAISDLKKDHVVTGDMAEHEKYGIGTQKITVISPDSTFAVYVGNSASLSRNFLRIDEKNEVFIGEGFHEVFTPMEYRDMSLGLIQYEAGVTEISAVGDDKPFSLKQSDGAWMLNGKPVEKEKVSFFINDLKTIKADDINQTATDTLTPVYTLTVTERGLEKKADFFDMGGSYLVKIAGNEFAYQLDQNAVEELNNSLDQFGR